MTIALLTATLALIYLISIMHAQATPPDLDPRQLEEARARLWRLILPEQLLDFGEATPPTSPPAKGAEAASEKLRLRSAASLAQRVRHSIAELRTPTLQPQLWQNSWTYRPSAEVARERTPLLDFINRGSGGRQGEATLVQLKALLSAHQVVDLSLGHAEQALQSFRTVGRFRVLVCGGDGTVGWVLSLLDNAHLEYTPPVAILPLGTGNDLARALGWGGGTRMGRSFVNLLEEVDSAQVALLDRWEVC
jgi:diacylglycerol kinase (ATP)